jgi:hypothetical protein
MERPLEAELAAYQAQREQLLATAAGKFVLIHGDQVAGVCETKMDAIAEGYRRFGHVPFLVKQVVPVEIPPPFFSPLLGA